MRDVLTELEPIFKDILDLPDLVVARRSNAQNVEGWDSLAHVNLVTAIQQHFKIRFALGELQELKDVGEMIDLIDVKLRGAEMNSYRWEDLTVGLAHELDVTLTADMLRAFASLSGDSNPLHADAAYAALHGFREPVAFGMLTASFYSQLVGVHLPGQYCLLHGIDLHFVSPAFAGDQLKVRGEISFLNDAQRQAEIKARIVSDKGNVVSRAKIRVGLHVA